MKEFEISMVISTPITETEDSIVEKFIEWSEENEFKCGGIIKQINIE